MVCSYAPGAPRTSYGARTVFPGQIKPRSPLEPTSPISPRRLPPQQSPLDPPPLSFAEPLQQQRQQQQEQQQWPGQGGSGGFFQSRWQ
jgi:hypothetical protein